MSYRKRDGSSGANALSCGERIPICKKLFLFNRHSAVFLKTDMLCS